MPPHSTGMDDSVFSRIARFDEMFTGASQKSPLAWRGSVPLSLDKDVLPFHCFKPTGGDCFLRQATHGRRRQFHFRRKSSNFLLGALPFNAITFGHVVIATSQTELDRLRAHEQAHVRQYERWGVFFFVAYPAASLWQLLRYRRPYVDNWFEVQAREKRSNNYLAYLIFVR